MLKRAPDPAGPTAFPDLRVRHIACGPAHTSVAVHMQVHHENSGVPVLCIPGYVRNMSDFSALPAAINRLPDTGFRFILIDLPGRGRSAPREKRAPYSTPGDADVILSVLAALDIGRAVLMGEGHGGQAAMLAAHRQPRALGGAILINAGPVTDPRGLVRTRNNHRYLAGLRGEANIRMALRKIGLADHPGASEAELDRLADRLYRVNARGRLAALFDPRLVEQLESFGVEDAFEPQWPLFDCLEPAPLMIVRTQLTDQLRRATFEEMVRRRPDAATLAISGQGNPALLDGAEELNAIAAFLRTTCRPAAHV